MTEQPFRFADNRPSQKCPSCNGIARVGMHRNAPICPRCGGRGWVIASSSVTIHWVRSPVINDESWPAWEWSRPDPNVIDGECTVIDREKAIGNGMESP